MVAKGNVHPPLNDLFLEWITPKHGYPGILM